LFTKADAKKAAATTGYKPFTDDELKAIFKLELLTKAQRPADFWLAELAEIYKCGIDELLLASSTRTSDQAELIAQILQTLPEADRTMIVEVVQKIAERLKDRL
jgi:hypothetical protein